MIEYNFPLNPISNKDLERGYWFVTHKIFLKRLGYSFFILFNILIISFNAYKIINFYTVEAEKHEREMQELFSMHIDYEPIHKSNQPSPPQIGQIKILSSGRKNDKGTYDLIAQIYNPNEKFKIEFDYQFICNSQSLILKHTYVLPGQKKIIADFGLNLLNHNNNAQVKIINLQYERISAHEIADPISFINDRLIFEIKNVEMNKIEEAKNVYKISYDFENKSAYNYWDLGLTTLLYKDSEIVGIDYIALEKFQSGEKKEIELTWYEYLPTTIKVSIIPEADVFDKNIYMKFEGKQKGLAP
ncbi:MAG: hypothetical protein V1891_03070 [bacterium]